MRCVITGLIVINLIVVSVFSEPIKVVYFNDFAPFSWDDKGEVHGLFKDIAQEIFSKRLGLTVENKAYPWERAQRMVIDGTADVMITTKTNERMEYAIPGSMNIFVLNVVAVTYEGHPNLEEMKKFKIISEFKAFIVSDYIGNGWGKTALKDLNVRMFPDVRSCLRILAEKNADVHFTSPQIVRYFSSQYIFKSKLSVLPAVYDQLEFFVFIGKKSRYVNDIYRVNDAIGRMYKDGTMKSIYQRY